jgi:two-component system, LuxR family, response regulator FixJ
MNGGSAPGQVKSLITKTFLGFELDQSDSRSVRACYAAPGFDKGESKAIMDQSRAAADAKHVLLVLDDDPAVRDSLKFSLGIEGFDVRVYASPNELLNDNSLPAFSSCLIVDYHMPAMNGLDVIAKLRERRNSILAILMTGLPNANLRQRASAAGVVLVEKPIRGTALIECIHALLDGQAKSCL